MRNEQDIFSSAGLSARDQVTDWVTVKKNIGDKVAGKFMGYWEVPPRGEFKAQLAVALKTADGKVVGINLNDSPYMRPRVEGSQIGDDVGIRYEGDKDTGKIQKAKIIKYYNPDMEERRAKGQVVKTAPEAGIAQGNTFEDFDAANDDGAVAGGDLDF